MTTFNSCTQCVRSPGIIHNRTTSFLARMDDLATERHGSLMSLTYYLTCYQRVFVQTGTGWRPATVALVTGLHCRLCLDKKLLCTSQLNPREGGGGGGRDGAGIVHRPSALFCIVRPPRHIFLSLIPAPRGTSFSLSDPMRGDFCILPSSCPDPGSHWLRPCFSIRWQRSLPAPSSVPISCTTKLLCYPITLTTAGGDD